MKKIMILIMIVVFFITTGCSSSKNVSKTSDEDLSEYFNEFEASFVLLDSSSEEYTIYNSPKSEKQVPPCSSFKIINSLIGLETDVIEDENTEYQWDGTKYGIESWNQNHTLATAVSNSVVWYFQELASNVGEERMQDYLNKVDYGNKDISGGITKFWLQSSLKISPKEQVEILKKFYAYELPFSKRSIDIVKKIIVLSEDNGIRLSGKTGSGEIDGKNVNGWFVGYVEKGNNVYFFATNIEGKSGATGVKAKELTLQILRDKKLL